jgi:tRNA(Ile2) C34 agmatinyltransferase TiaS
MFDRKGTNGMHKAIPTACPLDDDSIAQMEREQRDMLANQKRQQEAREAYRSPPCIYCGRSRLVMDMNATRAFRCQACHKTFSSANVKALLAKWREALISLGMAVETDVPDITSMSTDR